MSEKQAQPAQRIWIEHEDGTLTIDQSFESLLNVAAVILERHYPPQVFPPDSQSEDLGPRIIAAVRRLVFEGYAAFRLDVTDEMVKRATAAMLERFKSGKGHEEMARAALSAALGEAGNG